MRAVCVGAVLGHDALAFLRRRGCALLSAFPLERSTAATRSRARLSVTDPAARPTSAPALRASSMALTPAPLRQRTLRRARRGAQRATRAEPAEVAGIPFRRER